MTIPISKAEGRRLRLHKVWADGERAGRDPATTCMDWPETIDGEPVSHAEKTTWFKAWCKGRGVLPDVTPESGIIV